MTPQKSSVEQESIADGRCRASVVIPAHNEEAVIGRLLAQLCDGRPHADDVVVVCNGCTDRTSTIARSVGGNVRVIELDQPSKDTALRVGNASTAVFPRVFVDADVVIGKDDIRRLAEAVGSPACTVLAAAPSRRIPKHHSSWAVRAYYEVWEQMPPVRYGLFGRGVIAVSAEGFERLASMPPVMGDDLAVSDAFTPTERRVVDSAVVTVYPPRHLRDLYRRRVRAATGNAQADELGIRRADSAIRSRDLAHLVRQQPRAVLRVGVFVAVSIAGRIGASQAVKRRDFDTWRRDESSRVIAGPVLAQSGDGDSSTGPR